MEESTVYEEDYCICQKVVTKKNLHIYIYNGHDFEFFTSSASRCACFKSLSALILASSSRTPF